MTVSAVVCHNDTCFETWFMCVTTYKHRSRPKRAYIDDIHIAPIQQIPSLWHEKVACGIFPGVSVPSQCCQQPCVATSDACMALWCNGVLVLHVAVVALCLGDHISCCVQRHSPVSKTRGWTIKHQIVMIGYLWTQSLLATGEQLSAVCRFVPTHRLRSSN